MRVRLLTLGCRVNQYETQALRRLFAEAGFEPVDTGQADVVVVNSCAVTGEAERKCRALLRRLRREQPGALLALTGCLPQACGDDFPEADLVTGAVDRARLPRLVRETLAAPAHRAVLPAFSAGLAFEPLTVERFDDSFQRAYLKVEDGCDRFCSYCMIPAARGPVRSRPPDDIAREAARLVAAGYREIVLTGVNLSRYGADLGLSLPDALAAAARPPGDYRLRLGSVEPQLLTDADWQRLCAVERLCPHFHLPLQSGCDATLARMGRRTTTADFVATVERLRALRPGCSLTTDLIAGFPGETEAEFSETCRFVASLGLLRGHVFAYSARPGTPAATFPDHVCAAQKRDRARRLSALCAEAAQTAALAQIGRTVRVLCEADGGGYADDYLHVRFAAPLPPGFFVRLRLVAAQEGDCLGQPL